MISQRLINVGLRLNSSRYLGKMRSMGGGRAAKDKELAEKYGFFEQVSTSPKNMKLADAMYGGIVAYGFGSIIAILVFGWVPGSNKNVTQFYQYNWRRSL